MLTRGDSLRSAAFFFTPAGGLRIRLAIIRTLIPDNQSFRRSAISDSVHGRMMGRRGMALARQGGLAGKKKAKPLAGGRLWALVGGWKGATRAIFGNPMVGSGRRTQID
jgi:hypothetical protein